MLRGPKHPIDELTRKRNHLFDELVLQRTRRTSEFGRMGFLAVATLVTCFMVPLAAVAPVLLVGSVISASFGLMGFSRGKKINEITSQLEGIFMAEDAMRQYHRPAPAKETAAPEQVAAISTFAARLQNSKHFHQER